MDIITDDDIDELGVWFAPDFDDNREKDFENISRVRIVPMTGRDKLRVDHAPVLKTKAQKLGKDIHAQISEREWAKQRAILEKQSREFANWNRKSKKTGVVEVIDNAKVWIDTLLRAKNAAYLDVLNQTYNAILDSSVLEEGLVGESNSPRASASAATSA